MLPTIMSTHPPATDLGHLAHKDPSRTQSFDLAFGTAHVFYPEADPVRCTSAVLEATEHLDPPRLAAFEPEPTVTYLQGND